MSSYLPVPLQSDTSTRPTLEMRQAIASAEVGDEQQGRDPTVNRLQDRVAELLGKEAALWMPGGTMCNLVAVKVHTNPGEALLADAMAHILRAESAGLALASGVLAEAMDTDRGIFSAGDLEAGLDRLASVHPPYAAPPRLVCLEQTHNLRGGTVWSLDEIREVAELARSRGLRLHMDGARLLNACVATGVGAAAFCSELDSVWIDFTKSLGAPIGAVLAGSSMFIEEARRMKHLFGGAMRQAGIAAAGCIYALDHHVDRLAIDHENARLLAAGLNEVPGVQLSTTRPESNMVFFDVRALGLGNREFLRQLAEAEVEMGQVCGLIRAVTHLDVSRAGIETAVEAIREIAARAPGQRSPGPS